MAIEKYNHTSDKENDDNQSNIFESQDSFDNDIPKLYFNIDPFDDRLREIGERIELEERRRNELKEILKTNTI